VSSGEEFLQEFFEKKLVSNIIPQNPKLGTKNIMKRKGKALGEE
jgi:hypothetical protein